MYAISLIAEFVCNDRPLLVRSDGELRFPVLFFYPDDLFTGSGLNTRPDYKAINRLPKFQDSDENFMVFPPIPYGPFETVSADSIELDDSVAVMVSRKQLVGAVNLNRDFSIARSTAAAAIFGYNGDRELVGKPVGNYFTVSQRLEEALEARFSNSDEVEAYEEIIEGPGGLVVKASLSAFRPRARPPSSVRLTLREEVEDSDVVQWVFPSDSQDPVDGMGIWDDLDESVKGDILGDVDERRSGIVRDRAFQYGGKTFTAKFETEIVRFPFRPIGDHYFGLDSSGRDVLARILYGLRISLNFGLALVLGTMVLGVIIGGIQGYKGGLIDLGGQRLIEIWEALPFLYIMIFMGSVFGRGFLLLLVVYGVFNWISMSYYIRGEFLKLRKQPFVEAAHCLGLPSWKIMARHILPNSVVPIVTFFPFYLVGAIFSLSALDYLGFGLPPPTPSWGELLAQAQEFRSAWWLVTYPTLVLIAVILLGVFIGEGIRAAFDPRVNSRFES